MSKYLLEEGELNYLGFTDLIKAVKECNIDKIKDIVSLVDPRLQKNSFIDVSVEPFVLTIYYGAKDNPNDDIEFASFSIFQSLFYNSDLLYKAICSYNKKLLKEGIKK